MFEDAKIAIKESSKNSSVYIGCDSLRYKKKSGIWYARYSTVVVLHLDGNKGCRIFHNTETQVDYSNLRVRLMNEVFYAYQAALEIIEIIGERHLEIHLDLNADAKHKSNVAVIEALGYIKGTLGIDAKIKPDAFAASHVADHVVRN